MPEYRLMSKIGAGTYGAIHKAERKGQEVAVKRNFVGNKVDFCGSLKEYDILRENSFHPHVVSLSSAAFCPLPADEVDTPPRPDLKDDLLSFSMPLAKTDGRYLIYKNRLELEHVCWCMCNILLGLEHLHNKGIIHRDVKPGNVLWYANKDQTKFGTLALCDFGMARRHTRQTPTSPGVVTCWYRAPEVCKQQEYDEKIDCWSAGCIFYEMLAKKPLIRQQDDDKILEQAGKIGKKTREDWKQVTTDTDAMDTLIGLLQVYPGDRLSASQALDTKFFDRYRRYISKIRSVYCPAPEPHIQETREQAMDIALSVFAARCSCPWYSHRALFLALDIFQRYLDKVSYNHSENGFWLRFMVCLYIAVKYFCTMRCRYSFEDIVGRSIGQETKDFALKFELYLLSKILQTIYRPNEYETQPTRLTDNQVLALLRRKKL